MMFSFRKNPIIGLDIGSSSVKMVQLKESSKGYQLVRAGVAHLEPEVVVDGAIMNHGQMADVIRELMAQHKLKSCDVVLSVSGHSVIIKRISLPVMSEEELAESIKWEAEQYIPFAIDDVNLDFQILGQTDREGQMDVLLVAVKRDKISDYLSAVTEAGLNPVIVDVDAFALENMFEINYEISGQEVVALINLGASVMNINIMKGGISTFTRDSNIGGYHYTEALQKEFGLTYEDAEKLKKGEEVRGVTQQDIRPLLDSLNDDLLAEISRSLDFFRATSANDNIDRVILSGGGCKVSGLSAYLTEHLEMPVELVNPFKNITVDSKVFDFEYLEDIGPLMAVGVGLAMRRMGDR